MIIGWQENIVQEEIPPRWMWPFDAELEAWFDRVDQERRERSGDSSDASGESMMQNELVKGRGRG